MSKKKATTFKPLHKRGVYRSIASDAPGLPPNIMVIDDPNIETAFMKMVQALCQPPVNCVVWNGGIQALHHVSQHTVAGIASHLKTTPQIRKYAGNIDFRYIRTGTLEDRLDKSCDALQESMNQANVTNDISPLFAFYKTFFQQAAALYPSSSLEYRLARTSKPTGLFDFHQDGYDYQDDALSKQITQGLPSVRLLVTHQGVGTVFLDERDVRWCKSTPARLQVMNKEPIFWQAQENAICAITRQGWPHTAITHSAPAFSNDETRILSFFEYKLTSRQYNRIARPTRT